MPNLVNHGDAEFRPFHSFENFQFAAFHAMARLGGRSGDPSTLTKRISFLSGFGGQLGLRNRTFDEGPAERGPPTPIRLRNMEGDIFGSTK